MPQGKQATASGGILPEQPTTSASLPLLKEPAAAHAPMSPAQQPPASSHRERHSSQINARLQPASLPGSTLSGGFPGFAVLASQQASAATEAAKMKPEASQGQASSSGGEPKPLLFPPAPSQEPMMKPSVSTGDNHTRLSPVTGINFEQRQLSEALPRTLKRQSIFRPDKKSQKCACQQTHHVMSYHIAFYIALYHTVMYRIITYHTTLHLLTA